MKKIFLESERMKAGREGVRAWKVWGVEEVMGEEKTKSPTAKERAGSTRSAATKNMLCVICMCIISRDHKP